MFTRGYRSIDFVINVCHDLGKSCLDLWLATGSRWDPAKLKPGRFISGETLGGKMWKNPMVPLPMTDPNGAGILMLT